MDRQQISPTMRYTEPLTDVELEAIFRATGGGLTEAEQDARAWYDADI
jgi:hypothetical protein